MKIYKKGNLLRGGKSIAIDTITENGTNDLLVDIYEDGNRQALRIVRNGSHSQITLCHDETYSIDDIIGEVFVRTWTDGIFNAPFMLSEDFLSDIQAIDDAVFTLRRYKEWIFLV